VIDIGCGDAFVVQELARAYPTVRFVGVDTAFNGDLLEEYRSRVTVPNLWLLPSLDGVPATERAAAILLMDVVEHEADDVAFFRDLCRRPFFGEDTRVLVTVPSFSALFSSHDRLLGHYRRYSRRTLTGLLRRVGLVPIQSGYLFSILLPVRAVRVVRERLVRTTDQPEHLGTWRGSEPVARALAALLTLDGLLGLWLARFGVGLPGLSNFAVCRKSA
jgi:hypothetical protein